MLCTWPLRARLCRTVLTTGNGSEKRCEAARSDDNWGKVSYLDLISVLYLWLQRTNTYCSWQRNMCWRLQILYPEPCEPLIFYRRSQIAIDYKKLLYYVEIWPKKYKITNERVLSYQFERVKILVLFAFQMV